MRAFFWLALVVAGVLTSFGGCSDEGTEPRAVPDAGSDSGGDASSPPLLEGDCDPLVPSHCGLPFPSDVWLRADPSGLNPSGKSVRFGPTTLPARVSDGQHFPPERFFEFDGWSPSHAPMTHLPGATAAGCATPADIALSLTEASPSVLLDVESMQRVPHWVDVDQSVSSDDERMFMIRPAVRLRDGARYIVAIRRVVDASAVLIEPSPTFLALRDDLSSEEHSVNARRALYADIFAKLESAGVARSELQLAWDYTTATKSGLTRQLVSMRDQALGTVGADGPELSVKSVQENPNPELLRRIVVTMKVPLYLTLGGVFDPSQPLPRLVLDEATGLPRQNGTMDWDVVILVPHSVTAAGAKPHGLLQNGHGLFGSKSEGNGGYLARMANGWHWIAFSTDFFGFADDDVPLAGQALVGEFEALSSFFERQLQGHVTQLLAMRMMMGRVAKSGISDSSGKLLVDPAWIDPSLRAYRGDSQGGIMGAGYMALSTDVTRGLVGEPGMPYSLLLNRSVDWPTYGALLNAAFPNGLDIQIMLALVQLAWDRTEPGGLAAYVSSDLLPGTPRHAMLMHVAIGDHQVTPFGAHIMARTVGAKLLSSNDPAKPYPRAIWGIDPVAPPVTDQNVIVEYDFGLSDPLTNVPNTEGCDPHDRVRDLTPSYVQSDRFFRSGIADWDCDGICNCDGPGEEQRCAETFAEQCQ
jgi:hypothetical protein